MKITLVYAVLDPDTCEVRYVGKTCQKLSSRISGHRKSKENNHRANWFRSIYAKGKEPIFIVLEECYEGWQEVEQFWISYLLFLGANLTNATKGGEGAPGGVWKEESKEKQRKSACLPHRVEINRVNIKKAQESNKGRKQSDIWKAKKAEKLVGNKWNLGRKQSAEWIENAHAPLRGVSKSAEVCFNLSKCSKHKTKLTENQVVEILELHYLGKYPIGTIAKMFLVTHQTIKRIIDNKGYLWLEHPLRCPLTRVEVKNTKGLKYKRMGTPHSQEAKDKIRGARKGKKASEETKRKLSESHKGKVPANKGIPRTKEQVDKQKALTQEQVSYIRKEYEEEKPLQRELALKYNISMNTIHRVIHHKHPYKE